MHGIESIVDSRITGFVHYCETCKQNTKHHHPGMGDYLVRVLPKIIIGQCEQCGHKVKVILESKTRSLTADEAVQDRAS